MMGQGRPWTYFIHSAHYLHLETPTSYCWAHWQGTQKTSKQMQNNWSIAKLACCWYLVTVPLSNSQWRYPHCRYLSSRAQVGAQLLLKEYFTPACFLLHITCDPGLLTSCFWLMMYLGHDVWSLFLPVFWCGTYTLPKNSIQALCPQPIWLIWSFPLSPLF